MFGEDVTPNHRKLATEFVLLDNFYATGGNCGDGHQWVTQANETSYALWPGYVGRSYPFDGTDPIAYANSRVPLGSRARAREDREGVRRVRGPASGERPRRSARRLLDRWQKGDDFTRDWKITAPLAPLNAVLAKNYPSYSQSIPDVVRAQIFLKDLGGVDGERHDAEPGDPAAAERSHPRRDAGLLDAEGDGGRQRSGARADRRGAVEEPVLAEDGDPRRRRRRAERRRSCGRAPHGRARDLAVHPARRRRLDVLRAPEHGEDDRADARACRRCRCSI